MLLVGTNAPSYSAVQIKVDITGPSTPKIIATDSSGVEYDIAQLGSWGPPTGFAVQGTFTNTTPIKATFYEDGNYTIKLSLLDLSNNNSVITSNTFTIEVGEPQPPVDNTDKNNTVTNSIVSNTTNITELPKTGTSFVEYLTYFIIIGMLCLTSAFFLNRKKFSN